MSKVFEYKALPFFLKQIDDRTAKQIFAVMGNCDSGNDIIWNGAFTKTLRERMDEVRVLWQHDSFAPPVGVPKVLQEIGKDALPQDLLLKYPQATGGLYGEIEYLDTPRGNEILTGIRAGALVKNSIGYVTVKADFSLLDGNSVRNLRELRLMDVSPVNWGMNDATTNLKLALPYRDTGIADKSAAWSAPTLAEFTGDTFDAVSAADAKRIAAHFAWAADLPPESFGDLKLPHHKPAKSGVGPAVWDGVKAAMGALMGARGGVDLPDGDRKGVYDHLAGHYEQFGQTPPDFKFVEAVRAAVKAGLLAPDLKVGRMLSADNLDTLQEAMQAMQLAMETLQELCDMAAPPKTQSRAARERRARSLELALHIMN